MSAAAEKPTRVLSLAEVADRLDMRRPNVAKYLARHGVIPAFAKAQGYLWFESDIERLSALREEDADVNLRRRESALRRHRDTPPELPAEFGRVGPTMQTILAALQATPVRPDNDKVRSGLYRLRARGWVEPVPGEQGLYQLTTAGREVARNL